MAYKYSHPYDWLMSHVDEIISTAEKNVKDGDPDAMLDATNQLRSIISTLAIKHDSDTIQDEFQSEMDQDGYFDEVEEKPHFEIKDDHRRIYGIGPVDIHYPSHEV